MSGSRLLVELVVVFGTAALTSILFQALRLPVVLGYVLAGLVIGPEMPLHLVPDVGLVHVLSELGVILLMFTVGLELPLAKIAKVGLPSAGVALFEVALVIAVGTAVASALGWSSLEALFCGACLAIASTMLVVRTFEELGYKGGFTDSVFGILVFEDLIAIVLLAVLAAVGSGAGLAAPDVVRMLLKLAGFLALLLVGGLLVVPPAIRWIGKRAPAETLLLASLLVCFGAAALAHRAGYSVALGAFLAGVMVAESGRGHAVFVLVRRFRDVFAMMFFVSIGMTIDPRQLVAQAPTIGIFTVVVLVTKPIGVALGVFFSGNGVRRAVRAGVSMAQIGELSFVIAGIGAASGVLRPAMLAIAVGVACATMLTAPFLIRHSEGIANAVAGSMPKPLALFVSFYEGWLDRLRGRERIKWHRVRRAVAVLAIDTGVIGAITIAAGTIAPRFAVKIGLDGWMRHAAVIAAATLLALPFAFSMVRRVVVIASVLAMEVIPNEGELDLGRAPRRALMLTIELAIAMVIAVPFVAVTQPFVPGGVVIGGLCVLGLVLLVLRSIKDFQGHVRAGAELILELLSTARTPNDPAPHVETILPGFGEVVTIALTEASPAVGRSLADLDLRARTGATVLAIVRGDRGFATPSPTECLHAGDRLAITGSMDALATAREVLDPPPGDLARGSATMKP